MNFIKGTWNSLFQKEDQQQHHASESNGTQQGAGGGGEEEGGSANQVPEEVLDQLFDLSAHFLKESKVPAKDQDRLQMYGLFKQARVGDCNVKKPQIFDLVGKAKWEAWNWLRGMTKKTAMGNYIFKANQIDPSISSSINKKLCPEGEEQEEQEEEEENKAKQEEGGKVKDSHELGPKAVEQIDYSDEYSHPYFKPIAKGEPLPHIEHGLLMLKNDSPEVYPLHFAIEKERVDLMPDLLAPLSVPQIEGMADSEGTGILEYAQLMENHEILQLVRDKLDNKQ